MVPASTNSSRLDQTTHTLVLASSSSESSSLSSSHSSASIPEMGNPASSGMVTELPSTPSATSLPTFSLPPYLQGPKESSNNANFQGRAYYFKVHHTKVLFLEGINMYDFGNHITLYFFGFVPS